MHDLNFWFSCIMLGFQFSLSRQKREQVSRCFDSPYERPLQELLFHQDCSPHLIKNFPRPVPLFVTICTFIVHFLNNSFIVCKQMHMDLYIVHMRYLHPALNMLSYKVLLYCIIEDQYRHTNTQEEYECDILLVMSYSLCMWSGLALELRYRNLLYGNLRTMSMDKLLSLHNFQQKFGSSCSFCLKMP